MDISTNPLTINAADVSVAGVTVWIGNVHVLQCEFQNYIADADTCDILNMAGKVFWHGNGAADLETVRSGHVGWCMGGIKIGVGGITNGTVRIYIK
jgi:hypothetical protein